MNKKRNDSFTMKIWQRILFALHVFIGIGGTAGGYAGMVQPIKPLGVPMELLQHSPFQDYFIPGIILFTVIGIGNIVSAVLLLLRWKYRGYSSSIASWGLVIWIIVQCIMMRSVNFMHVITAFYGLIQAVISMRILLEEEQFPMNILIRICKNWVETRHKHKTVY